MSVETVQPDVGPSFENYPEAEVGFRRYLHHLGDELFPFDGYRDYQDEILYQSLEALFVDGCDNVIIDGPTGIGKSPINVTIGRVTSFLNEHKHKLEEHFDVRLTAITSGKSFYTTPQKQLRNQLANDDDLMEYVRMLKSRRDYICQASGDNCDECDINADSEQSCRTTPGCTYWGAKMDAIESDIAVLTFAMLVIDNQIPATLFTEMGGEERISFEDRDVVIVDEGHNLENQVASLFAGFSISVWKLPDEVFGDAGDRVSWDADRFEDVSEVMRVIENRAKNFIEGHEGLPKYKVPVDQCENFLRKIGYCRREVENGKPWVVNVDSLGSTNNKKIEIKPVDVGDFLRRFIWERGTKRVISSATIPFRNNIGKWAKRIGLPGKTKLISKPMPFPEENRLIHKNTTVASMSGDGEDNNWHRVVRKLKEIHSHHEGENGLIHTNSYKRAEKVAKALGMNNVHLQDQDEPKDVTIQRWEKSDKDILVSPSMMEGVDLYEDRCRWQVLLKVPFPYVADSRVDYLLNERSDWDWYMETASLDVQQSVGRAVRGPEAEEAASYYVIDKAFNKVLDRTHPPNWFTSAIRRGGPDHWDDGTDPVWAE